MEENNGQKGQSYDNPSSYYQEINQGEEYNKVSSAVNIPNSSLKDSNVPQANVSGGLEYNHSKNSTIEHKEKKINNLPLALVVGAVSGTAVVGVAVALNEFALDISLFSKNSSSLVFEVNKNNYGEADYLLALLSYDDDPQNQQEQQIETTTRFLPFYDLMEKTEYRLQVYYYADYYSFGSFSPNGQGLIELGTPIDDSFHPVFTDETIDLSISIVDSDNGVISIPDGQTDQEYEIKYLKKEEKSYEIKFSGSYSTNSVSEDIDIRINSYQENFLEFTVLNTNKQRFPYLNVEVFDDRNNSFLKKDALEEESVFTIDYQDEPYYIKKPFTNRPLYITVKYGSEGLACYELSPKEINSIFITHETALDEIGPGELFIHFIMGDVNYADEIEIYFDDQLMTVTFESDGSFVVGDSGLALGSDHTIRIVDLDGNIIFEGTFTTLDLGVTYIENSSVVGSYSLNECFEISDADRFDELQIYFDDELLTDVECSPRDGRFSVIVEDLELNSTHTIRILDSQGHVIFNDTFTTLDLGITVIHEDVSAWSINIGLQISDPERFDEIEIYLDNELQEEIYQNSEGMFEVVLEEGQPEMTYNIRILDKEGHELFNKSYTTLLDAYLDSSSAVVTYNSINLPVSIYDNERIEAVTMTFDDVTVPYNSTNQNATLNLILGDQDDFPYLLATNLEPESEHTIKLFDQYDNLLDQTTLITDYVAHLSQGYYGDMNEPNNSYIEISESFWDEIYNTVSENVANSQNPDYDIQQALYETTYNPYSYKFYDGDEDCMFPGLLGSQTFSVSDFDAYEQYYYLDILYNDTVLYTISTEFEGPIKPLVAMWQTGNSLAYYNSYENTLSFSSEDVSYVSGLTLYVNDEEQDTGMSVDTTNCEVFINLSDLDPNTEYTYRIESANGGICYQDGFTTERVVWYNYNQVESNTEFTYTFNESYINDVIAANPNTDLAVRVVDSLDNGYGMYSVTSQDYYGTFTSYDELFSNVTYTLEFVTLANGRPDQVLYSEDLTLPSDSYQVGPTFTVDYDPGDNLLEVTYVSGYIPPDYSASSDPYVIVIRSEDGSFDLEVTSTQGAIDFETNHTYIVDITENALQGETGPADKQTIGFGTYYVYIMTNTGNYIAKASFTIV